MSAAFLGVARSVTGRRWLARGGGAPQTDRLGLAIAERFGLPELVGRLLAARGLAPEGVEAFLTPALRTALPDPSLLKDMDRAADRLARAVMGGETIGIFADYDVDGASSAALLLRFFGALGTACLLHVPDRHREGYGPNLPALAGLAARGAGLVVTVDCGATAFAPLAAAARQGMEVIVLDHHVGEPQLPEALAVVNPNRLDESGAHGELAAVGVCFLLVVALNRALRRAGWYGAARPEPDPLRWLDLVALGTVCDVAPLTGVNRAFVAQGLKVLAARRNPGLAALADIARLDRRPDADHLGFTLGPRINAGGRVGESGLGADLLACEDPAQARDLAERLNDLNTERRRVEQGVMAAATEAAERALAAAPDDPVLLVGGEGWHHGVIGIVAGRLKDRFGRPACAVSFDGEAGRGSGRSIPGFDLGPAVIAAHQRGLLSAGGGHAMAAGFALRRADMEGFHDFLRDRFRAETGGAVPAPTLALDGTLSVGGASRALVDSLARLAPFGAGNAEPRFALPAVRIVHVRPVGENHLSCVLAGGDGERLRAIAFRSGDTPLGAALSGTGGRALHLAGRLRPDDWAGQERTQFHIDDAAEAG